MCNGFYHNSRILGNKWLFSAAFAAVSCVFGTYLRKMVSDLPEMRVSWPSTHSKLVDMEFGPVVDMGFYPDTINTLYSIRENKDTGPNHARYYSKSQ